jgi:L-ascorbate metabolism protein UlaG (beta-lactamase superfamily)
MKLRWLGHAGFKLQFSDPKDSSVTRTIYIDLWPDNPKFPEESKEELNDADLILVTHGHFDHSGGAPSLYSNAKNNGKSPKIVCNFELSKFFSKHHDIPDDGCLGMNKGCPVELDFCTITMVSADHSSGCMTPDGSMCEGGSAAGFVIEAGGKTIYHAGDTNVFGDMEIISELYEPEYALLPVGGHFTMGPREAAFAVAKFLKSVKNVIPMHFGTFPLLKGTPEQTREHFEVFKIKYGRDDVDIMDPYLFMESAKDL